MNFFININIDKLESPIKYGDKLFLIGSCFTEHIGNTLAEHKFSVLQNPNGILFDPASVCNSLLSYIDNKKYTADELFPLNEVWNSWAHHSRFSYIDKTTAIENINQSQQQAHDFLKETDWVIITLGSSFYYLLSDEGKTHSSLPYQYYWQGQHIGAANCHRAPSQWFRKYMMAIDETVALLDNAYHRLKSFNPKAKIIFTISPVRHLRDGVVDNNRSKARLIEAVHHLVNKFSGLYYFPAYELVIDVLRDYRFYDIDLAHPNYAATEYVMQQFKENYIEEKSQQLMEEIKQIATAKKHRPLQPQTNAHQQFLKANLNKAIKLQEKYSFLNFTEEINYFKEQK